MGLAGEHASWMFSKAPTATPETRPRPPLRPGITRRMVGELVSRGRTCPSRDPSSNPELGYQHRGAWQKTMPYGKNHALQTMVEEANDS